MHALRAWRHLLVADQTAVEAHLQAAEDNLLADAVSPLRRVAIALARALLDHVRTTFTGELSHQVDQLVAVDGDLAPLR